jgi:hypothetical protein
MKALFLALICACIALGDPLSGSPGASTTCSRVLGACQDLADAQDASIKALKAYSKDLESKLASSEARPQVNGWILIGAALVGGVVLGFSLKK